MIDLTFTGLLFPEHEQKHELGEGFFVCLLLFKKNSNLFFAFKTTVTGKLAEYCHVIAVFYSNRCYLWLVLKMAHHILKNLILRIYLQSKLMEIV